MIICADLPSLDMMAAEELALKDDYKELDDLKLVDQAHQKAP